MPAKLRISVSRKISRPNFGSVGADVGIEMDCDESLVAGDGLQAEAERVTVKLRQILTGELKRLVADDRAESPAQANGRAQSSEPARSAPPDRRSQPGSGGSNSTPRSGKALFAWSKAQEEEGAEGLIAHLNKWAKREKIPGMMTTWGEAEVAEAVAEANNFLER